MLKNISDVLFSALKGNQREGFSNQLVIKWHEIICDTKLASFSRPDKISIIKSAYYKTTDKQYCLSVYVASNHVKMAMLYNKNLYIERISRIFGRNSIKEIKFIVRQEKIRENIFLDFDKIIADIKLDESQIACLNEIEDQTLKNTLTRTAKLIKLRKKVSEKKFRFY